jgi:Tetracyclin repressor-like, C-terminal domain
MMASPKKRTGQAALVWDRLEPKIRPAPSPFPYISRMIATGRFPTLAKMIERGTDSSADAMFDKGLDCVLDGIEARLPRRTPQREGRRAAKR